jgi:hypothetical protein
MKRFKTRMQVYLMKGMTKKRLLVPILRLFSGISSFFESGRAWTGNHWTSRISHLVLGAKTVSDETPGIRYKQIVWSKERKVI